jgi:hypothetical protein
VNFASNSCCAICLAVRTLTRYDAFPALGLGGFLGGSAVIAASQTWKVVRIARGACAAAGSGSGRGGAAVITRDAVTAAGVEAGAGLGALLFLVGTATFAAAAPSSTLFDASIDMWLVGSGGFTVGALFLLYRHYVMKVS